VRRRVFHPAPLLWTFLAVALGIALSAHFGGNLWGFLASFVVFGAGSLVVARSERPSGAGTFAVLLFILSAISFGGFRYTTTRLVAPNDVSRLAGREVRVFGRVADEVQISGDRQRFDFAVDSALVEGKMFSAEGRARIYLYNAIPVVFGDGLSIKCKLEKPRSSTNPEAFNYRKSLELKGIRVVAFVRGEGNVERIAERKLPVYARVVQGICAHVERTISLALYGEPAELLRGLLLGKGPELPRSVRAAFEDSGTVHILAVSGLHVGIIAAVLWFLLATTFRAPKPLSAILCILALAVYVGVVGGRPSVLRASLMFSIILFAQVLKRPPNLLNSIGTAGFVLLLINPRWLFDVGFQLSFGATLGIAYLLPFFDEWLPSRKLGGKFVRKYIVGALAVSICATIGTAPLVALHFNRLQTIAPIANIFIVPFVGLIIGYGMLASVLSIFWQTGAVWTLSTNRLLLEYILFSARFFAGTPISYLPFAKPNIIGIVAFYAIAVGLPLLISKRLKGFIAFVVFIGGIILATFGMHAASQGTRPADLRVVFFDVGQGDCALAEFRDGRLMLIDGGPQRNASFAVAPFLKARGVEHIDAVVLSHPHSDHLGGLVDLMENFEFGAVYVPHITRNSQLYGRFLDAVDSLGIPMETVSAGGYITSFPEAVFLWPDTTAVSPAGSLLTTVNEGSIVFTISRSEVEFLFTGDIGFPTESAVESWPDIDVLKVAHHGSRYSTSDAFLAQTAPLVSVICVGEKNRFGHPTADAMSRIEAVGSKILRTDISGAITVDVRADSFFVKAFDGTEYRFSGTDRPTAPGTR